VLLNALFKRAKAGHDIGSQPATQKKGLAKSIRTSWLFIATKKPTEFGWFGIYISDLSLHYETKIQLRFIKEELK